MPQRKMILASGHHVVPMDEEELQKRVADHTGEVNGMIRLEPGGWLYPKSFPKLADHLYHFKWKPSDVVVMTWPKCGTTWTQEIIWTMRNNPNLDNPHANVKLITRVPFLDLDMNQYGLTFEQPGLRILLDELVDLWKSWPSAGLRFLKVAKNKIRHPHKGPHILITEVLPEPRTIKTHLPFSLFSPELLNTAKVVFVARNPKDVIVSFHHHMRLFKGHGYKGSFEDYVKYFVDDNLLYGPYWLMLKEAWEKRSHPNLHFIFYEDLKADIMKELNKLNDFIGANLNDTQLKNVAEWTSFSAMKKRNIEESKNIEDIAYNKDVMKNDGGFVRKGKTGDWKEKFTPELETLVDEWTKTHLGDLGLEFKYSL
ncbi:unnamed protein product [Meganyctiphanes norvegica]|uniref:Sulfotransferase domain-containing protein n=1 Tax=Meganyctiphanes norvegica TaxID=48144 RepID=A0AAV2PXE3_MEGNR